MLKSIIVFILLIVIIGCNKNSATSITKNNEEKEFNEKIKTKAVEALKYCKEENFNTDFCILIDMNIHSGKNRMFVYDFKKNEIERSSLCAHGSGKGNKKVQVQNHYLVTKKEVY